MATIELPPHRASVDFNLRRWEEVLADAALAKIEGRIETDRFGRIIMSSAPGIDHGGYQAEIAQQLKRLMPRGGRVTTECPISTADGVRAADVAWSSPACLALARKQVFTMAPDICVEVLSPSNSPEEMLEKRTLYFDAGAKEVWLCIDGQTEFYDPLGVLAESVLCPGFPNLIHL